MDPNKYLSTDESAALEVSLRERMETDTRNAVMILTALYSGARASELLAIQWENVNLKTGEVRLETLKGGRPRTVVVPTFLRRGLERLKAMSPERPFPLSYQRLYEIWCLYRPVPKTFHALRHTFGRMAYDRTKDIRFVMYALGHRSIRNTQIYTERDYSAAEYKKRMRVR